MVHRHNCALLINCLFELSIGLLLDGLCILQLFDQLHLEHFHLHHFLLLLLDHGFLFSNLSRNFLPCSVNLLFAELLHLSTLNTLLLFHDSILELFFAHLVRNLLLMSRLLLLLDELGLLRLLFLLQMNGVLYLLFLVLTVSTHSRQLLSMHFLALCLLLHGKSLAALTLFICELRFDHVGGTPLRLLNLLPRLHFLLLEERDSVCEQLRILLNVFAILLGSEDALDRAHRVEAILALHTHALAEAAVVAGGAPARSTIALIDFG